MDEELPTYLYPVVLAKLILPLLLTLILCFLPVYSTSNSETASAGDNRVCLVSEEPVIAEYEMSATPREESSAQSSGDGKEHSFDTIIKAAACRYQVDPALVKAIIMAESGYDPRAVSKKGARGLMQLMPDTAESLGVEDSFDPEENIDAGVRYLKLLMNRFDGNTKLALAAYNAGYRKVRMHKGVPPFRTTKYYIAKVFEYYERFKGEVG